MTAPRFFNSATVRAPETLIHRGASWRPVTVGVRYGLIEHPTWGPVLIDTGYSPRATSDANRSLALKLYGAALRPRLVPDQAPAAVLARLGHAPTDVRTIIVTHFHPDHIAALRDFPAARFIASKTAWSALCAMPRQGQLRHAFFAELLPPDFADRLVPIESLPSIDAPFGLGPTRDLLGDGTCLAVDLPGHALGHFGLFWPGLPRPLLYAVDASWLADALLVDRLPRGPAQLVYSDCSAMRASAEKVRRFAEAGGDVVLCHDRITP